MLMASPPMGRSATASAGSDGARSLGAQFHSRKIAMDRRDSLTAMGLGAAPQSASNDGG